MEILSLAKNMSIFSRLPVREIMVAGVLGVFSGMYIFAPGIIEFSSKIQDKSCNEGEQSDTQNGSQSVLEKDPKHI